MARAVSVRESAREVPVAAEADVLVVGGGCGAVAAAIAAAQGGAKVFLAAPRTYLGDDMTATLRLWLEPGETPESPLAKAIFLGATNDARAHPDCLSLSYSTDVPSGGAHPDTTPPRRLTDGAWRSAAGDSVQYAGDVTVTADLRAPRALASARLMAFSRSASKIGVSRVAVSLSDDGKTWRQAATITAPASSGAGDDAALDDCQTWSATVTGTARHVRFAVTKADGARRVLLGEIEVVAAPTAAPPGNSIPPPRPMHVKRTLDEALLRAGVTFLYGCQPTHVLRDATGRPCGIAMANRAGRQTVIAKTVVDATDRALVARLAGAEFRSYPAGLHEFRRVVIGGEPRNGASLACREIHPPFSERAPDYAGGTNVAYRVFEYTLRLPMADDTPASWAAADQTARTLTYDPAQQFTSDVLFQIPPDALHGRGAGEPLGAFRPRGVDGLYVLGGCADVPRNDAARLLRPLALIDAGTRIGTAAAAEAKDLPAPVKPRVAAAPTPGDAVPGEVRELLSGVRPLDTPATIPQEAGALPVWGDYDVVVVGGGTAGGPAGIGAARQDARTLVVESLSGLGGVGTLGTIAVYCSGNRVGFTASFTNEPQPWKNGGHVWSIEQKAEWLRGEILRTGGDVWFGATGCGALTEDRRVTGVVLATPQGRGVVRAKTVVDATGNSDIAAAAGADCLTTDASDFGMQGTGLPPRLLGVNLINTDYTLTDESDLTGVWHLYIFAKRKFPNAFDLGQLIDTRERRRIVGDHVLTVIDQLASRTFPDTIVQARGGGFDTHGYVVDPFLHLWPTPFPSGGLNENIPYRSLLPKGWDGILVAGLGISAHRDAVPLIRMQPDIQNGGYAAGVAAAMAVKAGVTARTIDVGALQRHLVAMGGLTSNVLTDADSVPASPARLAAAVRGAATNMLEGAVVFANAEAALPLLREAFAASAGESRVQYAAILAMLGDRTGFDDLLKHVRATPWDAGWQHRGSGNVSRLDGRIIALGHSDDRRAVPAIIEKLRQLEPGSDFSHFRATALALELLGDPEAAPALADALEMPGVAGHAHDTLERAIHFEIEERHNTIQTRHDSLRELMLARALHRCGDLDGIGAKTLRAYANDLRGPIARHVRAVLATDRTP